MTTNLEYRVRGRKKEKIGDRPAKHEKKSKRRARAMR